MYKILRGIFDYNKKKSRVLEIDLELSSPKTWTEQISIKKLNKEKYLFKYKTFPYWATNNYVISKYLNT